MLKVTAGRDIECPLRGADAVPQHDNRNGEPNLHVHEVLLNRAVRAAERCADGLPDGLGSEDFPHLAELLHVDVTPQMTTGGLPRVRKSPMRMRIDRSIV